MSSNNLLKNQVKAEMKKRRLIFLTFVILCFVYLSINLVFGDMGLVRFAELNRTKADIEKQITDINKQNEQLKTQIDLLKKDPFYSEKFAREEYGLAKPDEYIFQYDK